MAAMGPTDGDRDVLGTWDDGLRVPLTQHPEPPDEITSPITTRRAIVRADGQVDAPSGTHQLVGDLNTGRTSTDYQNCAIAQLGGIPVVGGMDLLDPGFDGTTLGMRGR